MTKIIEKNILNDMHLHIDKAYVIIQNNLPVNYVQKVLQKLPEDKTLTSGIIRNIKNRVTRYPNSRINVLNALVEVANEYQRDMKHLKGLVTK
jgi:hypothetical protein